MIPSNITRSKSRKKRQWQRLDSAEINSTMIFFIISVIFPPAQLFNIFSFSSSLYLLFHYVFILVYFKSHILLLPSLIPFCHLLSSSYFFILCFSFFMPCFYSALQLFLLPQASQNNFSYDQSSHIIFPFHILSPPLLIFACQLLIWWLLWNFLNFNPRVSLICISDLKFYCSLLLFHFAFFLPFFSFYFFFLLLAWFSFFTHHFFSLYPLKITFHSFRHLIILFYFIFLLIPFPPLLIFAQLSLVLLGWMMFFFILFHLHFS